MAEVRKAVKHEKYNIDELEKKVVKKKKNKKTTKKESNNNNNNKGVVAKTKIFINGVKDETKKVHWTSKKDMVKYSGATIAFIIFFALFFYLINVLFALVQSLFN